MANHQCTDNATERWADIPGYEGAYQISDHGRVRGLDRIDGSGRRWHGRLIALSTSGPYDSVSLWQNAKVQSKKIHSTILEAFVGPRPEGMHACHNDGDSKNNNLANLRWDTVSANSADKVRHGTDTVSNRPNCQRGHALVEPNLVKADIPRGRRTCKACERARGTARKTGGNRATQESADAHYQRIMHG